MHVIKFLSAVSKPCSLIGKELISDCFGIDSTKQYRILAGTMPRAVGVRAGKYSTPSGLLSHLAQTRAIYRSLCWLSPMYPRLVNRGCYKPVHGAIGGCTTVTLAKNVAARLLALSACRHNSVMEGPEPHELLVCQAITELLGSTTVLN